MLGKLLGASSAPPPAPDTGMEVARGLIAGGRHADARALLERRLAEHAGDADALALLGWALFELGDADAARSRVARALALAPHHVEALNTLGVLAGDDHAEAAHCFRLALAAGPGNAAAQYNLAQRLFFLGEYEQGLRLFDARHRAHHGRDNPLAPLPAWDGGSLAGRHAFVWCDWGGLGDHLLFARAVAALRRDARPARVTLGAQPECVRLFATLEGVDAVVGPGALPPVDVHCPLFDLPCHLGLAALAATPRYLDPGEELRIAWHARLAGRGLKPGGLKVGVAWSTGVGPGDPPGATAIERSRAAKSIPAAALKPLAACGAQFVSLQLGASDRADATSALGLIDATGAIRDLADTAAIIDHLDAVVAVDTSVAHLAAALGKPVWLLLRHGGGMFWPAAGETARWYPTLAIARAGRDGWVGAITQVADQLARLRAAA
jgi:hypothetical protein